MSRTASTSTQQTSSSSGPGSTPALSRATTQQSSLPSFSPTNPIDDFVLFPEDDSSWNADMSFPDLETQDLGQFNFDLEFPSMTSNNHSSAGIDDLFDFSFNRQADTQFGYTPVMNDQYGLDQWAEPQGFQPVSHSRPHPALSTNGSGELGADWQSGWLQAESLISPRTTTFADNYWPDGSVDQPQQPQSSVPNNPLLSDTPDWSLIESTIANSSSLVHSREDATNNELSQASQPRRTRKRRAADSLEQLSHSPDIGILDPSDQQPERVQYQAVEQGDSTDCSVVSRDIAKLQNAAQLVSKSLRRIKRAPADYSTLSEELQQLEGNLARLQSSQHSETILPASDIATIGVLTAQLSPLFDSSLSSSSHGNSRHNALPQLRPGYARELQVTVRRLVRSLCATINSVEAHGTGTSSENRPMLTSGRNLQLQVSTPGSHEHERQTPAPASGSGVHIAASTSGQQNNRRSPVSSGIEMSEAVLQSADGNFESLDIYLDVDSGSLKKRNERECVPAGMLTVRGGQRRTILLKAIPSDLLRTSAQVSTPIFQQPEQEQAISGGADSSTLASSLSSTSPHDDAYRRTLSSGHAQLRAAAILEEQTGGIAISQPSRAAVGTSSPSAGRALPSDQVEMRPSVSRTSAMTDLENAPNGVLVHNNLENSRLAPISQQPPTVLQTVPPRESNNQYSFAGTLAILGFLALASSVWHPPVPYRHPPSIFIF
jgi:hypothetical protein